jgi:hypothetical protein
MMDDGWWIINYKQMGKYQKFPISYWSINYRLIKNKLLIITNNENNKNFFSQVLSKEDRNRIVSLR